MKLACRCEHVAHTDSGLTPKGHKGHPYGKEFETGNLVLVLLTYGLFVVCKDCEKDCCAGLFIEEKP